MFRARETRPGPGALCTPGTAVPARPRMNPVASVEFEARVSPAGDLVIVAGRQHLTLRQGMAGRTLTVWADLHSIHLLLDGHVLRTVASRLLPQDLAYLAMRGARQAGPEPAKAAIQRKDGRPVLAAGQAVEIDRKVQRDGHVTFNGQNYQVGMGYDGTQVTMRLDGHLMHAVAGGALAGTWPSPVTAERAARMNGARAASTALPPAPLPATPASSSPSSSKTPATASSTARKNSPSSPARTPRRSPGSTSAA
jgi:hypothetical protein